MLLQHEQIPQPNSPKTEANFLIQITLNHFNTQREEAISCICRKKNDEIRNKEIKVGS